MARFPNYSDKLIQTYLDECALGGIYFWMPLYLDQRSQFYEGLCYRCGGPVGISMQEMERTFWRREGVPPGQEPKVQCDQCGTKLSVVPREHLLREMMAQAHPSAVQKLKNRREDELARSVLSAHEAPRPGENTLVDIWNMLYENYGDLPAPVQMWLEENDGIEQMVEEIKKRQQKSISLVRKNTGNEFLDQLMRYKPGDFGTRGVTGY